MKMIIKFLLPLLILTVSGCSNAFSDAMEAFRRPQNTLPEVSLQVPVEMVPSGTEVSGTASDGDNDTLSYSWSEVTSCGLTFTDKSSPATTITFRGNDNRDVVAHAVIRLTVSDGEDSVSRESSIQVYRTDVLYMTTDGAGTGNAPDNPFSGKFNDALSYAQSQNKKALAVAAGNYTVAFPSTYIVMLDGIDLYGGYDPLTWKRDITTYPTSITDSSNDSGTNQSVVYIGNSDTRNIEITDDVEINGLSLTAGINTEQRAVSAIRVDETSGGIVTITRCSITSQDSNAYQLHGIRVSNSNAHITQNFINLKGVTNGPISSTAWTHGVSKHGSGTCLIEGNAIFAGTSTSIDNGFASTFGVFVNDSNTGTVMIRNNCIHAGNSEGLACGILVWQTPSKIYIQNNTIYAAGYPSTSDTDYSAYGINFRISSIYIDNNIILMHRRAPRGDICPLREIESGLNPVSIDNNNLFIIDQPTPCYYYDNGGSGDITDFITALASPAGTLRDFGNLNENLIAYDFFESFSGTDGDPDTMEDNNWRIRNNSNTVNIRYGGRDLSQFTDESNADYIIFSNDFDGKERSAAGGDIASNNNAAGWTIGAYETD